MKTYRATELKQSIGEVLIAAAQAPVYISKHQVPRYVLMTIDEYQAINDEIVESKGTQTIKQKSLAETA